MNEISLSPIQNVTSLTDAAQTSVIPDGMPKKRNYLPWLLGILVLLIAISVLIFYQITKGNNKTQPSSGSTQPLVPQKQTTVSVTDIDMSSWKTYSDNAVGFSIKYPDKWLSVPGKINPPPVCPSQKTFQSKDCMDEYIVFKVFEKKSNQLLKEAIQERDKSINQDQDDPQYYENNLSQYLLDIGAIQANYMGMYGPLNIYIPINPVANISYLEISSFALDSDTFYQILSTFEFTERNSEAVFILYESKKFGVSFEYDGRLDITETGNGIDIDSSHYLIKVFNKNQNDTLEEAINKTLLANYKRSDCFAILSKVNPTHPDYISAEVSYPPDKNPQDESSLPNCDSTYYKTNGARVFWMDPSHPDKFIFIEGGQSVIYSSGDIDWPSFKFLD